MIELKGIDKRFEKQVVFSNLNIAFEKGSITGISAPSGYGKTTLLNLMAGLLKPDAGSITGVRPDEISYIFQEARLIPWKTVKENIEFVLKEPNKDNIETILESVGLTDFAEAYPKALSGGMKQRVAIARAYCYPAELLLMDEPFNSLDQILKKSMMDVLMDLRKTDQRTIVFVSHQQAELAYLCDQVIDLTQINARN